MPRTSRGLYVFTRHSADCKCHSEHDKTDRTENRRCNCMKYIAGTAPDGAKIRESANTRDHPRNHGRSFMVNHYYWYCLDPEFGPFFLKFCSYFPYNAKLCLNGHEYAKCQLRQQSIPYQALDNGFRFLRPSRATASDL